MCADVGDEGASSVVSRERFVATMAGCVNVKTRADGAGSCDPLELKRDWLSDFP